VHELSLVSDFVRRCCDLAEGRPVAEVTARCPSSIDVEEVVDGFSFLTSDPGSPAHAVLGGARLEVQAVAARLRCECGFDGALRDDHMAGHISVCPSCGRISELRSRLELVSLKFTPTA